MAALKQVYRTSFSTLCVWAMMVLFFANAVRLILTADGGFTDIRFFSNFDNIILIALIFSGFMYLVLRSEVSAEGLTSFSTMGSQIFLRWEDISYVKTFSLLGLSYCVVDSEEGDRIFLARFLSKQEEFDLMVTAITPKENPLHQCIAKISEVEM